MLEEVSAIHVSQSTAQRLAQHLGEAVAVGGQAWTRTEAQTLRREAEDDAEAGRVIRAWRPDAPLPLAHQPRVDAGLGLAQEGAQRLEGGGDVVLLPPPCQALQTKARVGCVYGRVSHCLSRRLSHVAPLLTVVVRPEAGAHEGIAVDAHCATHCAAGLRPDPAVVVPRSRGR
jgi:hypothetical protein